MVCTSWINTMFIRDHLPELEINTQGLAMEVRRVSLLFELWAGRVNYTKLSETFLNCR